MVPANLWWKTNHFQDVSAVLTDKDSLKKIRGIGFDATCSLVALDSTGHAVTVSPSREAHRNIIMWLDHRALDQAQRINNTKHKVLSYVGGGVSPEMEIPKILWLKEKLPGDCWGKCALFLELPEFLTYKATGDQTRWEQEEHRFKRMAGSCVLKASMTKCQLILFIDPQTRLDRHLNEHSMDISIDTRWTLN